MKKSRKPKPLNRSNLKFSLRGIHKNMAKIILTESHLMTMAESLLVSQSFNKLTILISQWNKERDEKAGKK